MDHLRKRGICEEIKRTGADAVAAGIMSTMQDEWMICHYEPPQPVYRHNDNERSESHSGVNAGGLNATGIQAESEIHQAADPLGHPTLVVESSQCQKGTLHH